MEQPNLSYINKLSGGDKAFEEKLIGILKKELPEEKKVYLKNLEEKNFLLAAENVHKLKHKISILGLEKSYEVAENYEDNLKKNDTTLETVFMTILDAMASFLETI